MPGATAARRRALFLKHHEEDDPGFVAAALARRGFAVEVLRVEDGTPSVSLEGVEVLGILGSKWSVYDEAAVGDWIHVEFDAIREADRRGVAVLGICFGAQALCAALGGTVEPADRMELGWVDLEGAPDEGIPAGPWFQFHTDRCVVPEGAAVLARNDVCVQAFRIGPHLGVQFHPEIDAAQFARWLSAGADEELAAAGLSAEELLEETARHDADAAERVDRLVDGFLEGAAR